MFKSHIKFLSLSDPKDAANELNTLEFTYLKF